MVCRGLQRFERPFTLVSRIRAEDERSRTYPVGTPLARFWCWHWRPAAGSHVRSAVTSPAAAFPSEAAPMRKLLGATVVGVLATAIGIAVPGCSDEAKESSQVTTSSPGGKVTQTVEKSVKTQGDNPPSPSKNP